MTSLHRNADDDVTWPRLLRRYGAKRQTDDLSASPWDGSPNVGSNSEVAHPT